MQQEPNVLNPIPQTPLDASTGGESQIIGNLDQSQLRAKFNPFISYEMEQKSQKVRMSNGKYIDPFNQYSIVRQYGGRDVPRVDNWVPGHDQVIFSTMSAGAIVAPIREHYKYSGDNNKSLDIFVTSTKKCYNSNEMRQHMCLYLNYFEEFFDPEQEYFEIVCYMKFIIDNGIMNPNNGSIAQLDDDGLVNYLQRYILSPSIIRKVDAMVEHNYNLKLDYKNINNPSLQYGDEHAKVLMKCSILINMFIPLLTHYAWMHKIVSGINTLLLKAFDTIITMYDEYIDIFSKLYETAHTNVSKSEQSNIGIWAKQDIRGRNVTTHSIMSIENIILNIMPKYVFSENIISMNYSSIINNTSYQIVDIEFEYSYIPLSSSKRDEDNVSEFDKFEASLVKQNEARYISIKANKEYTMRNIEQVWGPFDQDEIDFYIESLGGDNEWLNSFQYQLIFLLFYKWFGDDESIRAINKTDYIKLVITAKRILLLENMLLLPYIISGKIDKLNGRKSVNKKESLRLQASENYNLVMEKYRDPKLTKIILGLIATIISSEFRIIDYHDKKINGRSINVIPDIVIDEFLAFVLLV